jgi:hypothetical protein
MCTLKNHILLRHPWSAAIIGFCSIYIVWVIPALFFWNLELISYAYIFGDRIFLPLFNAVAFYLYSKSKQKIPWQAIIPVLILCVFLVIFFEPDASAFRKTGHVSDIVKAYHSFFIFVEFSFITLMCWIYPFLRRSYKPWPGIVALVLLIEGFLVLVFVADDQLNNFPLWEKILTAGFLALSFVAYTLNRKFSKNGSL